MYGRITPADRYERAKQRCQEALTHYMMKVSETLSRATVQVFCSKDDHLIRDYSKLASYFMENAGTPEFAGVLEKIVQEIRREEIEAPEAEAEAEIKVGKRRKKRIRPVATGEAYKEAIANGWTREIFERNYRVKNNYSYGGWAKQHGSLKE